MKSLIILLVLSCANAMASTVDDYTFPINGSETEQNFLLTTTQTRTAYRKDTVAHTCYRSEFAGYRNSCNYYPEVRCYETRDSARICNSIPVYRCQQIPEYRDVPYTCYKTVSTPYEVTDHQVQANFNVKITSKPKEPTNPTSCSVGFTMKGDTLKSHADCSDYLIFSTQQKTSEIDQKGTVIYNYNVALKILDAASTLAPLDGGISEMHMDGNNLIFRTGDLSKNPNFNLKLFIERKHFLKSDETLINRNITPNEYTFEKSNDSFGIVKINLDKLLGGLNSKKKHTIKVSLDVKFEAGVLLNNKVPKLDRNASLIIND